MTCMDWLRRRDGPVWLRDELNFVTKMHMHHRQNQVCKAEEYKHKAGKYATMHVQHARA